MSADEAPGRFDLVGGTVAGWLMTATQIRVFCVVIEALVASQAASWWCLVSLTGVCRLGVSRSSPRRL